MKRRDFIKHLEQHGCEFLREGANHTVYVHRIKKKVSTVPRHNDIYDNLCRKICKDLDISKP
ncbi:MAG: type II toxin-antitoxin system HicA family toxin [Proteobacteria bacterium]|nr:type II toxin-antitoxin system HicA family toxin [Pseudomonadota bacterium]